MLILFYEYLDITSDAFKTIERPATDLVLRLLNTTYLEVLGSICRADTFPDSIQKVRANMEAIRELVQEETVIFSVTGVIGKYTVNMTDLSESYAYMVRMMTGITRIVTPVIATTTQVETRPLHDTETDSFENTAYNKPLIRVPGITFSNGQIKIYCDIYTTLKDVTITYIRVPPVLTLGTTSRCLLEPENLCRDIVRKAVNSFIQSKNIASAQEPKKTE